VVARRRHARGEATQQGERIHVDSNRSVSVGALQRDAYETVVKQLDSVLGQRRAQDITQERFAPGDIDLARLGRSMKREPIEGGAKRLVESQWTRRRQTEPSQPLRPGGRSLSRDRRREEGALPIGVRFVVRRCVVPELEQTAALEVPLHTLYSMNQHIGHLPGLQMPLPVPREVAFVLAIDTIEKDDVEMGVESHVRRGALNDGHTSRLSPFRTLVFSALRVGRVCALDEDARESPEQGAVVREPLAPWERERQHPLPQPDRRQHFFDEVGRRGAHAAPDAGGTEASSFAAKCDKPTLLACVTSKPRETSAEQTAVQVRIELFARVFRQPDVESALVDCAIERLDVVAHNGVEARLLGAMTLVLRPLVHLGTSTGARGQLREIDRPSRLKASALGRFGASNWPPQCASAFVSSSSTWSSSFIGSTSRAPSTPRPSG